MTWMKINIKGERIHTSKQNHSPSPSFSNTFEKSIFKAFSSDFNSFTRKLWISSFIELGLLFERNNTDFEGYDEGTLQIYFNEPLCKGKANGKTSMVRIMRHNNE